MRLNEIQVILEGYKEAKQKFLTSHPDEQQDIEKYIEMFRDLVNRNQLQGNEKNIDYWGKQGYQPFKEMVEYKSQQKSKTQVKRSKAKGDSITLAENDKWLIVIPLDKDASCFHGKNTDWCTTKPNQHQFEQYFYDKNITLIYFIRKKDLNKWAIAYSDSGEHAEYFDKNNDEMAKNDFDRQTGLDAYKFIVMAQKKQGKVQSKRDKFTQFRNNTEDAIENVNKGEHNYEIEDALIKLKDGQLTHFYMGKVGPSKKYKKELQVVAVNRHGVALKYIETPDKELQLTAVKENGRAIAWISNPDKDVQLVAVKEDGNAIQYIDAPDKDVQLAAIKKDSNAIQFINNPDKDVQLAAVKEDGNAIQYIDAPDKDVQLSAVRTHTYAISWIGNPDKDVQLVAVTKHTYAIEWIDNPHPDVVKYVKENK